jgi:hypothetical protein
VLQSYGYGQQHQWTMHIALPIGFVTDVRGLVGEPAKAELAACKSLAKRKPASDPPFFPLDAI